DVFAVPERALDLERVNGSEVVGILTEAACVDFADRPIGDGRRFERIARARLDDARGLIFVPSLARGDLQVLRRFWRIVEKPGLTLEAAPRELVIVPHAHEPPARACILQIGVFEIAL